MCVGDILYKNTEKKSQQNTSLIMTLCGGTAFVQHPRARDDIATAAIVSDSGFGSGLTTMMTEGSAPVVRGGG